MIVGKSGDFGAIADIEGGSSGQMTAQGLHINPGRSPIRQPCPRTTQAKPVKEDLVIRIIIFTLGILTG